MNTLKFVTFALLGASLFISCNDDNYEPDNTQPVDLVDDNNWMEGTIDANIINWYRVTCASNAATASVEWAELSAQGAKHDYTGDIQVSAYQLDGLTAYFEYKDNGYSAKAKSLSLANGETQFLIKVELGESEEPGTYGVRASSAIATTSLDYNKISIGDDWTESSISADSVIGYKIDVSNVSRVAILWSEAGAPENTYTADITGSVYQVDKESVYTYDKDGTLKEFLDKNKSHSDDPKTIDIVAGEDKVYVHIKGIKAGTYAIKAIEITN